MSPFSIAVHVYKYVYKYVDKYVDNLWITCG